MITRSDLSTFKEIQKMIKNIDLNENDLYEIMIQLDELFIHKNISPGGAADLLALTYFLYFLERTF